MQPWDAAEYRRQARLSADFGDHTLIRGWCVPWLTVSLLVLLTIVFALEQRFALVISPRPGMPDTTTLLALGGLNAATLRSGQAYRMLSAPFLHAGTLHLVSNGLTLAFAGYQMERLAGRAWMLCVFTAGALAGSAASLALLDPATVSVGASGGITAILAALFLVNVRLPSSRSKTRRQWWLLFLVATALIPANQAAGAMHVDYGAHLGGALCGAILGFLLLQTWPADTRLPAHRAIAAGLAGAALLSLVSAGYAVAQRYPSYATLRFLIPAARYPHGAAEIAARSASLAAEYPRDPRSHLMLAQARLQRGDKAGAEQELRLAQTLVDPPASELMPGLGMTLSAVLALTLYDEGRTPEAAGVAAEPCATEGDRATSAAIGELLRKAGLCGRAGASGRGA